MITMPDELITWLIGELESRGWSHRELARRSGVSQAAISTAISGDRNPGADFCIKIAQALGEPPDKVLRIAGLLPSLPVGDNGTLQELNELVKNMPPEDREEVLEYARYRYQRKRPKRQNGY